MKSIIVTPVYEPYFHLGGPTKSVPKLKKLLDNMGYSTTVHTISHKPKIKSTKWIVYHDITILDYFLQLFMKTKYPAIKLTINVIKNLDQIDVLILNCGFYLPNLIIGIYAAFFSKCRNIIFIPRGSGSFKRRKKNRFLKNIFLRLENIYLKRTTLIMLDPKEQVSCYNARKIVYVPNIIEVAPLGNSFRTIDGIFLGRPEKEKGIDKFIELAKKNKKNKFCVIATHDNNYTNLARLVKNITVLIDPKSEVIKSKLSKSKFFFLYSYGEGLSMALLEATERGVIPLCNKAALPKCFEDIRGIRMISEGCDGHDKFSDYLNDDLEELRTKLRDQILKNFSFGAVANAFKSENLL